MALGLDRCLFKLFISEHTTAGNGQIALSRTPYHQGPGSQTVGGVIQYPSAVSRLLQHTIHIMPKSSICTLKGPKCSHPRATPRAESPTRKRHIPGSEDLLDSWLPLWTRPIPPRDKPPATIC
ncbi:hypothetical protein CEXT_573791 [Caerostris extrusa]|uniref:Uncharacterized protein n=1 Tax=Caerostris extrusa TaxID=172846 RepID=A0AAV4RLL8_CAEEX|nr:hypothetical protein CEXT_573791 [Caerostris extrusa]